MNWTFSLLRARAFRWDGLSDMGAGKAGRRDRSPILLTWAGDSGVAGLHFLITTLGVYEQWAWRFVGRLFSSARLLRAAFPFPF